MRHFLWWLKGIAALTATPFAGMASCPQKVTYPVKNAKRIVSGPVKPGFGKVFSTSSLVYMSAVRRATSPGSIVRMRSAAEARSTTVASIASEVARSSRFTATRAPASNQRAHAAGSPDARPSSRSAGDFLSGQRSMLGFPARQELRQCLGTQFAGRGLGETVGVGCSPSHPPVL